MPIFKFNKLVRDKLRDEYARTNQKATYRELTLNDHKLELKNKIIEETKEIQIDKPVAEIADEIADIKQALDDFQNLCGITEEQVSIIKQKKYVKKGGFTSGNFVETLELDDDDKWVDYYRQSPDIFPEIKK